MSPKEAAQRADQTPAEVIRAAFEDDLTQKTEKMDYSPLEKASSYIGMGCPYLAGPCVLTNIYNRGNSGRQFWHSDAEEVMEFRSTDGAVLLNYDTDHLFLVD